ncbi:LysR family transcriptional regulator [Marinobacterium jannaschii]|uniref:LysR family transcriptional regulator n=1 Tax=Marinobacterium jannaschii TaxID=64970 RepID=UPI000481DA5C|nr:LysR family transcriptional regulator [Marinobacterium jannaschii]
MELKHLQAFCLTAELGSVSAAARRLGKGQPLLSQWLADLEADLGVPLLVRSGNRCQLSAAGEQLLPQARQLITQAGQLAGAATQLSRGEPLHLAIGLDDWLPQQPVTAALSHFLQAHPELCISLQRYPRQELLQRLTSGELQLALATEEQIHLPGIRYSRIGVYEDCLVAAPDFALAGISNLQPEQLVQHRELVLSQEGDEDSQEQGYGSCFAAISDMPLLLSLLKSGCGYAMLPKESIAAPLAAGDLVLLQIAFEPAAMLRRVELLWRQELEQSQVVQQLLQLIREQHQFRTL